MQKNLSWEDMMQKISPEEKARFCEEFPHYTNRELAKRFGISLKSVAKRGYMFGLQKTEETKMRTELQRRLSIGRSRKDHPEIYLANFHKSPYFKNVIQAVAGRPMSEETKQKISNVLRKKRKNDIARVRCGLAPLTKMNTSVSFPARNYRRHFLRQAGYVVPKGGLVAYYNEHTNRNMRIESLRPGDRGYVYLEYKPISCREQNV